MEKVGQQKEIFAMFSTEIKQFKTSRKINGLKTSPIETYYPTSNNSALKNYPYSDSVCSLYRIFDIALT